MREEQTGSPEAAFLARLPAGISSRQVRFRAGQMLSDNARGVSCVGVVERGRVDVYAVALDGREVQLNTLGAGDCFGICNLLAASTMQTVLQCAEDTTVRFIEKNELIEAMNRDAGLATAYAALCNTKIQFLLSRIEMLTMQSCRGKVLAFLLTEKDENGRVCLHGTREELASRLGVSRAALFRELGALQSKGCLTSGEGVFFIRDIPALEKLLYGA